ncbi:MAG: 3-isopropylmalate dehydratase small subunit [Vicinamibacterales bacterium]
MEAERIVTIDGTALPVHGDDIDTDRILPARFLRAVTFEGFEAHVFVDDRAAALKAGTPHPFDQPQFAGATILLVNKNFGCGSSREHAPQGLKRWGIRAVIGESFSEIFFGNAVMIGMPCVTASLSDLNALMADVEQHPKVRLKLDLANGTCQTDGFFCQVSLPDSARDAFITGAWDTTGLLRERYDEVNAAASRLPYISGFRT